MNRGSRAHHRRSPVQNGRFNEAPIHESGKLRPPGRPRGRGCRFNEAPIHESGKSDPLEDHWLTEVLASMRPRFMNRGSEVGVRGSVVNRINRFNEAPIHESGK